MLAGVPPYRAQDTRKLESLIRSKRPPRALPAACPRGLCAIVAKALAPEAERRYASAAQLQTDLQAFLEHRPTVAEKERRAGRCATAGIEAARACLRKATRTVARAEQTLRIAGAVAWFAAGMALWIGGTLAWQQWHNRAAPREHLPPSAPRRLQVTLAQPPQAAPAKQPARPLPAVLTTPAQELLSLYVAEAEAVLAAYRNSSDPSLDDFDWEKAEICLAHAVKLGAADDRTLGELALSRGSAADGAPGRRTPFGFRGGQAAARIRPAVATGGAEAAARPLILIWRWPGSTFMYRRISTKPCGSLPPPSAWAPNWGAARTAEGRCLPPARRTAPQPHVTGRTWR